MVFLICARVIFRPLGVRVLEEVFVEGLVRMVGWTVDTYGRGRNSSSRRPFIV